MPHLLLIALGGAIGASVRHLTNVTALRLWGPAFPWHTAAINILGSFLIGVTVALLARRSGAAPEWRLFVATGVLGGFTTFSAFALDVAVLWERDASAQALSYVLLSVLGSVLAVFAGLALARAFA
ncbi:MAG TPA: fluoride efflux transporter CrcB [Mesorhizobium sp.]|jgi:CrcB protein|nr:fluoride efflux transporter CrcB [Mesorhizobium sp.]